MSTHRSDGGGSGSRLPSLDVYKKRITAMFSEESQIVSRKLDKMVRELRSQRLRVANLIDSDRYGYAEPLYNVSMELREDFFETLETLIDRHDANLVRVKALQLFLEFGAIEDSLQGDIPFGLTSLSSVGNIMRSSRSIEYTMITSCLQDPFCSIINQMTIEYLGLVADEISTWMRASNYPVEFATGLADCAKKFGKSLQMIMPRAQAWWEQAPDDADKWKSHADANAYNAISEVIHFTCNSPVAARKYIPELAIVLYTKSDILASVIKPAFIHAGYVYPPFKLISALAQRVPEAAEFFAGPNWDRQVVGAEAYSYYQQLKGSLMHQRMMTFLLGQINTILWDEHDTTIEPVTASYYLHSLWSLLTHSKQAIEEFLEYYKTSRQQAAAGANTANLVNTNPNNARQAANSTFRAGIGIQLLKRALHYVQISGNLSNACLEGVVLFLNRDNANHELFSEIVTEMQVHIDEIATNVQQISQKLLTTTSDQRTESSKQALVSICNIFTVLNHPYYSKDVIAFTQEHVSSYSRDHILFYFLDNNILSTHDSHTFIDDNVRLAAAICLSSIDINTFQHTGIQHLLDIFSSIPSVLTPLKFKVLSTLMYFLFKLAVHDSDTSDKKGTNTQESPGRVFRALYASEMGTCIFSLLERFIIEGSMDHNAEDEMRFVQGCIKFLMTGWLKYEFHADNLGSRPVEILTQIVVREQERLFELAQMFEERKQRYYTLIEQRRCVVSEEDLSVEYNDNPSHTGSYRLPPIRLKRYEHVNISKVVYQHSFIEQTTFGSRVKLLLQVLPQLKKIDIIVFRVMHQLANIICNTSLVDTAQKLTTLSLNEWLDVLPGKSIEACDIDEQNLYTAIDESNKNSLFTVHPLTKANVASVNNIYAEYMRLLRPEIEHKEEDPLTFSEIYDLYIQTRPNTLGYILKQGNEIVSFCIAAPYIEYDTHIPKTLTLKPINGNDITAEVELAKKFKGLPGYGFSIIEHYYFNPMRKEQMDLAHRTLLSTVSHDLATIGYCRCFILADRHIRQVLSRGGANLVSNDEFQGPNNINLSLYYWYTSDNIWSFSMDHDDFITNKIPETLLQLLLDDQNKQKIEEFKRQGKLPKQKDLLKRYKCKIRAKMEEFGGMLTSEFEKRSLSQTTDDLQIIQLDMDNHDINKDRERSQLFQKIVENEFKYGLVTNLTKSVTPAATGNANTNTNTGNGLNNGDITGGTSHGGNDIHTSRTPLWEKITGGSTDETRLECITRVTPVEAIAPQPLVAAALLAQLPPDLIPRSNPDRYVNEWMANELAASAREIGEVSSGGDGKALQRDVELELRRRRQEMIEHEEARRQDELEAEKRRKEWKLPPVLQTWTVPCTASILRSVYVILTKSQKTAFNTVLQNLIVIPSEGIGMLEAFRAVLSSFQYQLRANVLDALPSSNYNIAYKMLELITASLGRVNSGLGAALSALEYTECCLEIVKDISRLMTSLINSKNATYTAAANQGIASVTKSTTSITIKDNSSTDNVTNADDVSPASGETTDILPAEELVMAGICKTVCALLKQVDYINLFRGTSSIINEGNRKCRHHAQKQLFTSSKVLSDVVLAILLYDLEQDNETDTNETHKKSSSAMRDLARIYVTELLAHFTHVDSSYKYHFFNDFCIASIKADRSIRSSFIQQVIYRSNLLKFKEQLDAYLRSKTIIDANEYIINISFFEHSDVDDDTDHNGVKLFLVTNLYYYISYMTFDADIETQILEKSQKEYFMAQLVFLDRRNFSDIVRLYRDYSGQAFGIVSYVDPPTTRVTQPVESIKMRTDVFLHRKQGIAEFTLDALANICRDDTFHTHTVARDKITPAAFIPLFTTCLPDTRLQNIYIKLMTHCWTIRRDGTIVKRLLLWVNDAGNHTNSTIIITPFAPHCLDFKAGGYKLENIEPEQAWQPAKYTRLQLDDPKHEEIAKTCKEGAIHSLFNVSSSSVLPSFMSAMPSLPFGSLTEGGPFYFPISEIQSVDFTEDHTSDMIIRIRRVDPNRIPSVYIRFADDTGRELWRRELKKVFFSGSLGTWNENILPDLSESSRRKVDLL